MDKLLILVFFIVILLIFILKKKEYYQNCPVIPLGKCRPPFTALFYFHFVNNWTPVIKGKRLDFYLKSKDFKETILENIKEIWKESHINFDSQKLYYEDANENLSYYYKCDLNREEQFKSIDFNLEHADPIHHKSIIKESLVSMTNPFNRENPGFHIYFLPYIGKHSVAKTVFVDDYPVIFVGLYSEDENIDKNHYGKIKRNIDIIPSFKKNMDFSKIIAKHLGYLFGLKHSIEDGNLMNTMIDDTVVSKMNNYFKNGMKSRLKSLIEMKFNNLSDKHKLSFFEDLIKITQFYYITEDYDKTQIDKKKNENEKYTSKNINHDLLRLLNTNVDLTYIIQDLFGDLYYMYFINNPINIKFQDERTKKLVKLKSKRKLNELKESIKKLFDLLHFKYVAFFLSKILTHTSLTLNDLQIDLARDNAYKGNAQLHNYYSTEIHYNKDIPQSKGEYNLTTLNQYADVIGENVLNIDNVYKADCEMYKRKTRNCHDGPCNDLDTNCCDYKQYFTCMSRSYKMRNKDYKKDSEILPMDNEILEILNQQKESENIGESCEEKKLYMDTLNKSFI